MACCWSFCSYITGALLIGAILSLATYIGQHSAQWRQTDRRTAATASQSKVMGSCRIARLSSTRLSALSLHHQYPSCSMATTSRSRTSRCDGAAAAARQRQSQSAMPTPPAHSLTSGLHRCCCFSFISLSLEEVRRAVGGGDRLVERHRARSDVEACRAGYQRRHGGHRRQAAHRCARADGQGVSANRYWQENWTRARVIGIPVQSDF